MTSSCKDIIQEGLQSWLAYLYQLLLEGSLLSISSVREGGQTSQREPHTGYIERIGELSFFLAYYRAFETWCDFVPFSLFSCLPTGNRMSYQFIWSYDQRLQLTHSSDWPSRSIHIATLLSDIHTHLTNACGLPTCLPSSSPSLGK